MKEAPWLDTETAVRRYLAGWTVLLVTVLLSNYSGFLDHPERIFDVAPNSLLLERLHIAGVIGQLVFGCWLGFALILEVRPARRVCVALWFASIAALLAPLPTARQDFWLGPLLIVVAIGVGFLSHLITAALRQHAV